MIFRFFMKKLTFSFGDSMSNELSDDFGDFRFTELSDDASELPGMKRSALPMIILGSGLPSELGEGASVGGFSKISFIGMNSVGVYRSLVDVCEEVSNEMFGVAALVWSVLNDFSISSTDTITSSLLL